MEHLEENHTEHANYTQNASNWTQGFLLCGAKHYKPSFHHVLISLQENNVENVKAHNVSKVLNTVIHYSE